MLAIEGIGSWASHLGDLPNELTDSVPKLPAAAKAAANKVASTPAPGNEVVNTPAVLKPGLSRNAKIGLGVGALALVGIGVMKAMH